MSYSKYDSPIRRATRRTASDFAVPGGPTINAYSPATAHSTTSGATGQSAGWTDVP
jgi:hypothetical protein